MVKSKYTRYKVSLFGLPILICLILFSCGSDKSTLIIQGSYLNDSLTKGERFDQAYLKLKYPLKDTLLSRISFPFVVTTKLNEHDFSTDQFKDLQAFKRSHLFNDVMKAIKEKLPYDDHYKSIFATPGQKGEFLKIVRQDAEAGFRFVSDGEHWFLSEYTESLIGF